MLPIKSFIVLVSIFEIFTKSGQLSLDPYDQHGYLFTIPNTVWAGRREQACLTMYGKLKNAKVNVTVTVANTVTNVLTDKAYAECFEVDIPQTAAMNARILLQINFLDYPDYNIYKVNKIHFNQQAERTFIQTDRATYKPGDLVKIRILLYKNDLNPPKNLVIPTVRIRNPLRIVIAQWSDIITELGIVQLEHQLSEETTLGSWIIELPGNENSRTIFKVNEYILPRFDVTIDHANPLYAKQKSYNFTVCSKYTYGAPLKGTARLQLTSGKHVNVNNVKDLVKGCSIFNFNGTDVHKISSNINLIATVTEQGAEQIEEKIKTVYLSEILFHLEISPNLFQPGMPFKGTVQIAGNNEDLLNKTIEVCYRFAIGIPSILNYTKYSCKHFPIIDNERTEFVIFPFQDNIHSIYVTAKIGNESTTHRTINRWYSPSNSYIQISSDKPIKCKTLHPFTVKYTLKNYTSEKSPIEFHYLIKSKGDIIKYDKIHHVPNRTSTFKETEYNNTFDTQFEPNMFLDKFILLIAIDHKIYSNGELLVFYVRKNGEMVSSSIKFEVEGCLANEIAAGWAKSQVYPGEMTTFKIKAANGSLCAVSAVDKNTHILDPASNVNIEMLLEHVSKTTNLRYKETNSCKKSEDNLGTEYNDSVAEKYDIYRNYYDPPFHDTFNALNDMDLLVMTNLTTTTKPCIGKEQYNIMHFLQPEPEFTVSKHPIQIFLPDPQSADTRHPVRAYIPETWLFDLVPVGDSGETNFSQSIPQTITQWIGNTFCVSPTAGVGVAPTSYITSFKPFSVDILTPYSVKRNEVLHLKVTAFNYLNHSLPIKISLDPCEDLELVDSPSTFSACLGPSDSVTNEFKVTALEVGRIDITVIAEVDSLYSADCKPPELAPERDVIIKNILAQVEGFPFEETNSSYVCLNENSSESEKNIRRDMDLPVNAVSDYCRIDILVDADLMDLTIEHIGSLVKVPAGSGEQIMSKLAPNLYILRYLMALNSVTSQIIEKSHRYIKTGYERILQYRHTDGSFSVFGERNTKSSIFLTAFVMRVLVQSAAYVYIDQNVIDEAQTWIMMKQQDKSGCFSSSENLHHYDKKDTRDDPIFLTSYVLISLIDSKISLPQNAQYKARQCLSSHNSSDTYQMATSAYALLLTGAVSEGNEILDQLLTMSNKTENLTWWESPLSNAKSVETTAYAILALIASNKTVHKTVLDAAGRWLLTKRNSYGGFISTQDTAVALDALTRYALHAKSNNFNLDVTITTDQPEMYIANITNESARKHIRLTLKQFKSFININLRGTGCFLVQNTLHYNMPVLKSNDELQIKMDISPVLKNNVCTSANVTACVEFSVPDKNIDMAVLELSLPSGYQADLASLNNILSLSTSESKFKRFELKEDRVILYYSQLDQNTVCTPFLIYEQTLIAHRMCSIVRIYDYYNPAVQATATYEIPQCPI